MSLNPPRFDFVGVNNNGNNNHYTEICTLNKTYGKKRLVQSMLNNTETICIPVMFSTTQKYLKSRGATELLQIQTGVVLWGEQVRSDILWLIPESLVCDVTESHGSFSKYVRLVLWKNKHSFLKGSKKMDFASVETELAACFCDIFTPAPLQQSPWNYLYLWPAFFCFLCAFFSFLFWQQTNITCGSI